MLRSIWEIKGSPFCRLAGVIKHTVEARSLFLLLTEGVSRLIEMKGMYVCVTELFYQSGDAMMDAAAMQLD